MKPQPPDHPGLPYIETPELLCRFVPGSPVEAESDVPPKEFILPPTRLPRRCLVRNGENVFPFSQSESYLQTFAICLIGILAGPNLCQEFFKPRKRWVEGPEGSGHSWTWPSADLTCSTHPTSSHLKPILISQKLTETLT